MPEGMAPHSRRNNIATSAYVGFERSQRFERGVPTKGQRVKISRRRATVIVNADRSDGSARGRIAGSRAVLARLFISCCRSR